MTKDKSIKCLAELIRTSREAKSMSQQDLAKKLKVSKPTMCMYESGKRRIDAFMFFDICRILDIDSKTIEEFIHTYK